MINGKGAFRVTVAAIVDPDGPRDPYRSIWMYLKQVSFTQHYVTVEVNGQAVRTRVAEAGDPAKPPVVLLHGTGGHWETFVPNLEALSEHFRCIAFDMIGNGFTDKPDFDYEIPVYVEHVLAVMDALDVPSAHLVAMSLGAWVAAAIAINSPERVDRLVLMSPAGKEASEANMARIREERTRAVNDPTWQSLHAVFAHLIADERNRLPDLIGLRQAIYQRQDTRATIDHLLVLQDPAARDRNLIPEAGWRSIAAPVTVVASGRDHGVYQQTATAIADLIPDATVLEMPDVRHWPHFEDPAVFNEAAVRFLCGR